MACCAGSRCAAHTQARLSWLRAGRFFHWQPHSGTVPSSWGRERVFWTRRTFQAGAAFRWITFVGVSGSLMWGAPPHLHVGGGSKLSSLLTFGFLAEI